MVAPTPPRAMRPNATAEASQASTAGIRVRYGSHASSGTSKLPTWLRRATRAWSCALARAGSTSPPSPAPSSTAAMRPSAIAMTRFPAAGAAASGMSQDAAMRWAVTRCLRRSRSRLHVELEHARLLRRQEAAVEHVLHRGDAGKPIGFGQELDGLRHALLLDVADADLVGLRR